MKVRIVTYFEIKFPKDMSAVIFEIVPNSIIQSGFFEGKLETSKKTIVFEIK